ncbi:MAG TPA: ABC transporter permease [Segeticoccus sp.]|uniref:ABC transporter permease n=1 Tax=Segeticoccus sp. TaxID=2706531 RepID=UPI002D7E8A8A|nr:ABC transporter permease [Segeticoccus sp.]HET8599069.1 ABC transporter permease [Segeticoccus sp.]
MRNRLGARLTPYALVLPGGLWIAIFFVIPILVMLNMSTMSGGLIQGFQQTLDIGNYAHVLDLYHEQFVRSLIYGLITTVATICISYPVAYYISFHGGSRKPTFLFLLLLPFFVTFVLRTLAWEFLLSDDGLLLGPLHDIGLVPSDFHVLATSFAVIASLTYYSVPFMVLPIYVGLERINREVLEAAGDLYASKTQTFLKVVFPMSLSGVFAGVLLTFVPVTSDYVSASILGGTGQVMIGNIIETLYISNSDYPNASALSFVLMAVLLIGIFAYAKALGTEDVMEVSAA